MARLFKKLSKTAGFVPGTLIHVGEKRAERVKITIIDYDEKQVQEEEIKTIEECFPFRDTSTVTWINVDGVYEIEIIEKLGERFGFHPLLLEDIVNTGQRPKLEDFDSCLFIVLKMLSYDDDERGIQSEQVSLILGTNFVISFQEKEGDIFNPIRERIRNAKGRIRKMGADYLIYSLMDAIIDNYFLILEKIGETIETAEERLVQDPTPRTLEVIHNSKTDTVLLRKSIYPLREVISGLERGESRLIKKSTHIFLRDIYGHTIQVIDMIETFRDMISGMLDIYLSSVSNRMNEVMKVLTIIATIFIPLTFIAGVYGMNFKYMPELNWRYGYIFAGGIMLLMVAGMLLYFKRKKWL